MQTYRESPRVCTYVVSLLPVLKYRSHIQIPGSRALDSKHFFLLHLYCLPMTIIFGWKTDSVDYCSVL